MSGTMEIINGIITFSTGTYDVDFNLPTSATITIPSGSFTIGTVSSITAGTNLTGGTITTTGTISLSSTPGGLSSLGVGNFSFAGTAFDSTDTIVFSTEGAKDIQFAPNGAAAVILNNGTNAVPLLFYNSSATHYVGFKAGTLSSDTTWILPTADAAGVMASDGSGNLSLTASPRIYRAIISVSGTAKTFALSDANTFQQCSNGSAQTLTVDTNANVAFAIGTEIDIYQEGAGQVVIAAAGGVTIESAFSNLKIAVQYGGATLKKLATNTWALVGNLTT